MLLLAEERVRTTGLKEHSRYKDKGGLVRLLVIFGGLHPQQEWEIRKSNIE